MLIKGTTQGTTTDAQGTYSLNVPGSNATLVFSYVGYVAQEIVVGSQTSITPSLKNDDKALDEVVVIGYGTARKSDLTGAVATVKQTELQERPAPSLNLNTSKTLEAKHLLLPLPRQEMLNNPNLTPQNPGFQ